jgi:hypothetical protein
MANEQIQLDKKLLERGYWIATHRLTLERWLARGLYFIIILAYLLFFVQFGLYMYHLNQWQELVAGSIAPVVAWKDVNEQQAPLDIEFGTPVVFLSGENQYDFVIEAYNPNQQWAVESFNFQFAFGSDQATITKRAFMLPGERKYITVLGYKSAESVMGVSNFIDSEYRWRKVSRLPPLSWDFVEPPTYSPKQTTVEKGVQIVLPAEVRWKVRNASTLNIRSVVWQIAYLNGGKLAAISEYARENFPFLEERDFSFAVSEYVGRVDRVKIYPIVDIFDQNFSYLPQS